MVTLSKQIKRKKPNAKKRNGIENIKKDPEDELNQGLPTVVKSAGYNFVRNVRRYITANRMKNGFFDTMMHPSTGYKGSIALRSQEFTKMPILLAKLSLLHSEIFIHILLFLLV